MSENLESRPTNAAFADPALDRFAAAFLRLAEQTWIQQEQLLNLIAVLDRKGLVSERELADAASDHESSPEREHALRDFINRAMGPLREPG